MDEARFDRQILLFGRAGQEALERCYVAIVGLGGLGSHVSQQLAYLGVRRLAMIDMDMITSSSLNRVVGATPADASDGRPKVEVASREAERILPSATISVVPETVISEAAFTMMKTADFIFGCLDDDPTRFVLNEFTQAYEIPYLDIATDTQTEADGSVGFGGRAVYCADGERCLICSGVLDRRALEVGFSSARQREETEAIYGVPRPDLGASGPAVVSLNGILASLAVTEFMVEQVGLRRAERYIEYRGKGGLFGARADRSAPTPDCYYCTTLRGQGDAADVHRYVREGWGERIAAPTG